MYKKTISSNKIPLINRINKLNYSKEDFFIFVIDSNGVYIVDKYSSNHESDVIYNKTNIGRANSYKAFFETIKLYLDLSNPIVLACWLGDGACEIEEGLTFAFQKRKFQKNLLLPDIDIINSNFFSTADNFDRRPYDIKLIKAVFAGATT